MRFLRYPWNWIYQWFFRASRHFYAQILLWLIKRDWWNYLEIKTFDESRRFQRNKFFIYETIKSDKQDSRSCLRQTRWNSRNDYFLADFVTAFFHCLSLLLATRSTSLESRWIYHRARQKQGNDKRKIEKDGSETRLNLERRHSPGVSELNISKGSVVSLAFRKKTSF